MTASEVIFETLKKCVNSLLLNHKESDDEITDNDNSQTLCSCIESLFLHCQEDATYVKLARFIRRSTVRDPQEYHFWPYIKHYLPKTLIEIIEKSSSQRTHIGCCRVWVRLALNEVTLVSYLEAMLCDQSRLQQSYQQEAVLRDYEFMTTITDLLKSLDSCTFSLNLTCPLLDSWTRSIALHLARLEFHPIPLITANQPVDSVVVVGLTPTHSEASSPSSTDSNPPEGITIISGGPPQPVLTGSDAMEATNQILGPTPTQSERRNARLTECRTEEDIGHPRVTAFLSPNLSAALSRNMNEAMSRQHAASLSEVRESSRSLSLQDSRALEERLLRNTEEELIKEIARIRSSSSTPPLSTRDRSTDSPSGSVVSSEPDQGGSSQLPGGSNSLLAQRDSAWWSGDGNSEGEATGSAVQSEGETGAVGDQPASVASYSQLWNDVLPNYNQMLAAKAEAHDSKKPPAKDQRGLLGSTESETGTTQSSSAAANQNSTEGSSADRVEEDDVSSQGSSTRSPALLSDDWQMLGDDLVLQKAETGRLLDVYPGVDHITDLEGKNTVFGGRCARCEIALNTDNCALDYYDGRLYCLACHQQEKSIIPRDVINNWDFNPKPVSLETKRFLVELLTHPNINLAQRNPGLYQVFPPLGRLRRLRHQLSILWYQLTTCDARAAAALRSRLFPREYMLGSIQEVDLYSLEDLIIARTGVLEKYLQNAIDRVALPHVRSCRSCRSQACLCDVCRQTNRLIHLYEVDTYRRCSTWNCPRVIHVCCIRGDSKSVYCRFCRSHLDSERPASLGGYDTSFPQ